MTTDGQDRASYDVVVVGGGAAGLGGALTLSRARRSVLVVDGGEPRNAPADGVHNFLTRDGIAPAALLDAGRAEVRGYGGHLRGGRVVSAARDGDGFAVTLDDGSAVGARRLLVATGLVDELPPVPGVRERWGRDVIHCPYCHGWEVRDRSIGVLATGPIAVHQALMFRQLTADLTVFAHAAPPGDDEREQFAARGIALVEGEVAALVVERDRLTGVRMGDGRLVAREVVVVGPRFRARAEAMAGLGLEPTDHPSGLGTTIAADHTGRTAVPGVWVAGNVTDQAAQVVGAAAAGAMAGAQINADLIFEETRRAVIERRDRVSVGPGAGSGDPAIDHPDRS